MEKRLKNRNFQTLVSLPLIISVIIPLFILDIWMEVYHRICFPLYGMDPIKRSNYIKIDRHKLRYLTWYDKIGCAYCGYANGLTHYWTIIAARTEWYWCGIKHKKQKNFKAPKHHKNFLKYGDEKAFKKKYS